MKIYSLTLFLLVWSVNSRPSAWFGTSPICDHDYVCSDFDMEWQGNSKWGDGKYCLTSKKDLCALNVPHMRHNYWKEQETDFELRVMTYNVFQRPWVATHDGQIERTCRIPRIMAERFNDIDVIAFQEAFLGGCNWLLTFKKMFPYYGWQSVTDVLGSKYDVNGGVILASKYPLTNVMYQVFRDWDPNTADRFAAKGFIYASFVKKGKRFHVIGTHLQAQEGGRADQARYNQARQISQFAESLNLPKNEIMIVLGDMNMDFVKETDKMKKLFDNMGFSYLPRTSGTKYSYDPSLNDVVEPGESPAWYDMIGFRSNLRAPKEFFVETVNLKTDNSFSYCNTAPMAPYYVNRRNGMCRQVKYTRDLSDHFPVVARLIF